MEQAVTKLGAEVLDSILQAAMADPDAMRRFADDISPPQEPVQDYITDVDTRCALFDDLRALWPYHELALHATVFAAFMITPISEIRNFLQIVRDSPFPGILISGSLVVAADAIRACTFVFPTQLSY